MRRLTQLKPRAQIAALKGQPHDELLLWVDADTVCWQYPALAQFKRLANNGVAFLREDKSPRRLAKATRGVYDQRGAAFIPPGQRRVYINNGVMACAKGHLSLLEEAARLSMRLEFHRGPFMDQTISYYLWCAHPERFAKLPAEYNDWGPAYRPESLIWHVAGGPGKGVGAGSEHENLCQITLKNN